MIGILALLAGLDKYREFEGPMSHVPSEIRVCGSVGVGNGRGKGVGTASSNNSLEVLIFEFYSLLVLLNVKRLDDILIIILPLRSFIDLLM